MAKPKNIITAAENQRQTISEVQASLVRAESYLAALDSLLGLLAESAQEPSTANGLALIAIKVQSVISDARSKLDQVT